MVSVALPGGSLDLPIPDAYCALTKANPNERALIELQERIQSGINRVLLYAVPCRLIGEVRAGNAISEYAIWLGIYSNGSFRRIPPTHSLGDFIDEMARVYPHLDARKLARETARRGQKEGIDLSLRRMGVIDRDDNGIYLGHIANVARPRGVAVTIAGATAITLAERYPVSFNIYHDLVGEDTIDRLRLAAQDIARRHVAYESGANGLIPVATGLQDETRASWLSSSLTILFVLLGAAVGAGVVFVISRRVG